MPQIEFDGRTVHYRESGAGAPLVLLPPGASGSSVWRGVVAALDGRFRTIAVDLSGYGGTDPWPETGTMRLADEAALLGAVVAHTAGRAPVHLVGHCYGGAVALRYALEAPRRVASLVLIEPAAYPLLRQAGDAETFETVQAVNQGFIERARAGRAEEAFRRYVDYYAGGPGTWAAMPGEVRDGLLALTDVVVNGLTAAHAEATDLAAYRGLAVPTLLVHGETTSPPHAAVVEVLARTLPAAGVHRVAGAGHMLTVSHPEAVAGLIAAHVAAI